jgi:hypothetical protein
MVRVFMTALFALAAPPEPVSAEAPDTLDRRCYGLMAALAETDDPRIREAALVGAQYFLGRLDAGAGGFDPDAPLPSSGADAEREQLIRRCGALMGAGGRDFRALGQRLARAADPV